MSLEVNDGQESRGHFVLGQDLGKVCLLLYLSSGAFYSLCSGGCVHLDAPTPIPGCGIFYCLLGAGAYQWPLVPCAQITSWLENEVAGIMCPLQGAGHADSPLKTVALTTSSTHSVLLYLLLC